MLQNYLILNIVWVNITFWVGYYNTTPKGGLFSVMRNGLSTNLPDIYQEQMDSNITLVNSTGSIRVHN